MQFLKKGRRKPKEAAGNHILAGDIGGTNASIGIFRVKGSKPLLVHSFRFKNRELSGPHEAINKTLKFAESKHGVRISEACLGVAGAVSAGRSSILMTNIGWRIGAKGIKNKTGLKKVLLLNDFEALGYSINILGSKDIKTLKKAKKMPKANILAIGAGTGLGKAMLVYDSQKKMYAPISSEAGHMDFPAQGKEDAKLIEFIKKSQKAKGNASYEMILSGRGLTGIYYFLRSKNKSKGTKCSKEIDLSADKPEAISKYRKADPLCRETFRIFAGIYAVFARNCALDSLAFGGVYIAGGIAAKNSDVFGREFLREFERHNVHGNRLAKMPVYVITNSNAGLLGAGFAGARLLKLEEQ